ncbi:putative katanin P80 subunit [Ixodes scapularis]
MSPVFSGRTRKRRSQLWDDDGREPPLEHLASRAARAARVRTNRRFGARGAALRTYPCSPTLARQLRTRARRRAFADMLMDHWNRKLDDQYTRTANETLLHFALA